MPLISMKNYPATKCAEGTNVNEVLQPSNSSENGESMQTGPINKHYDANHLETMRKQTEVNLKSLEQDSSTPKNKEELDLITNKKTPRQGEANHAPIELNKNQDDIQKFAQVQEEYDLLKNFVDVRLKPLISLLKRMNAEKDLDLRASAKLIEELQTDKCAV
ncbi:hypothetical protein LSM04_005215 [Trypanosoma melophagium]|uniref:uncharacterized protein n=1 Tax=Trypanosoma melophagium TaxID=715481 RepID=UPI00351A2B42|nr:hypothetical protein LSM04_005215 [Trypanosoma melophagium]